MPKTVPNIIGFIGMEFGMVNPKKCKTYTKHIINLFVMVFGKVDPKQCINGGKLDIDVWHRIWHGEKMIVPKTIPNTSSI